MGETDVFAANYQSLRMRFYEPEHVQRAVALLGKYDPEHSSPKLARLLRDHLERPIRKDADTWKRDSIDFLLAYYSILEIASQIGFISSVSIEDRDEALAQLRQPDLVRYYEVHYPLLLPILFRQRLIANRGVYEPNTQELPQEAAAVFMRFTQLVAARNADWDVDRFLYMMDDGVIDGYDWSDLLDPLKDLDRFLKLAGRRKDPRGQALRGFGKFIQFCQSLHHLLERSDALPTLQSAMWHYNAYWFLQIGNKLRPRIDRALKTMMNWRKQAESPQNFDRRMAAGSRETQRTLDQLLSVKYGRMLLRSAQCRAVDVHHPRDKRVIKRRFERVGSRPSDSDFVS